YASGAVSNTAADAEAIGGLVGRNEAVIINSYATGSVTAWGSGIGGLAGVSANNGGTASIAGSYATGTVDGNGIHVGGLVGRLGA
ncbi:GLUG motif-containing protein, partial [Proteus mirabilis]|uniref:GLUG motif-containing protein n=1 Tax=Proteus mirabilis TaxID=584 RepID=UPI00195441B8